MTERITAIVSGALFAVGLALSGMTDPGKVLGFLDVAGIWDPSLAFVMAGAVSVHFVWLRWLASPRGGASHPPSSVVDARLLAGAALFGVGWGLAGYCPGPALVALAYGRAEGAVFVLAMLAGILLFSVRGKRADGATTATSSG
ncbi:MAG: YeeE/YedE family protein [Myxococcales bacterium]|nr:MAG: YeeE/YedE family protein [Myxococcales bacterium]